MSRFSIVSLTNRWEFGGGISAHLIEGLLLGWNAEIVSWKHGIS